MNKKIHISASAYDLFNLAEHNFDLSYSSIFNEMPISFDEFIAQKYSEDNEITKNYIKANDRLSTYTYNKNYPHFVQVLYHFYVEIFIHQPVNLLTASSILREFKETLDNAYFLFFDAYLNQDRYSKQEGIDALEGFLLLKTHITHG